MLKELLHTGIGAGVLIKEKVEEEMKRLEDEGKIKTSDAQNFLEKIEEKGKEQEEKNKEKIKSVIKEIIEELGIATKKDIQDLKDELK